MARYSDDAPTQVDDLASDASTSSNSRASGSSSLVTAHETLGLQEAVRTRTFMYIALGLSICQSAALPFVGGHPVAKGIFVFAIGVVVVAIVWLLLALRRSEAEYTVGRAVIVGYATIFAAFSGIYFYGVFSPGPVIVPLGVQFFCSGQSDKASVSVIATCAILYAVLAGLVMSGAIPDAALIKSYAASSIDRIVILLLVESIFAGVFITARATRDASLHAIEQHDIVVRSLAQRDALLREAQHELVHAMRVGGIGRYSNEVVGSFRLGGLIGRGAMGEVYDAVRLDTKEVAAVKLVHPQLLVEGDVIERFLREARVMAALRVPNVVQIVEASSPDAPIPYLAMERLYGEDLAAFLREHKRMGMRKCVAMMEQIAAGLDAAHQAGIIHRDLKPRNLFCTKDDVWKILDFGISKLDASEGTLTQGQIVGTPGYMAPEQARGKDVDHRADIFSLGVIAYRVLTGTPPFTGETSYEILMKIGTEQPVRPTDMSRLPEDVDLVLAIALAKNPKDRFATASDFAKALAASLAGRIEPRLAARAHSILATLPWRGP